MELCTQLSTLISSELSKQMSLSSIFSEVSAVSWYFQQRRHWSDPFGSWCGLMAVTVSFSASVSPPAKQQWWWLSVSVEHSEAADARLPAGRHSRLPGGRCGCWSSVNIGDGRRVQETPGSPAPCSLPPITAQLLIHSAEVLINKWAIPEALKWLAWGNCPFPWGF